MIFLAQLLRLEIKYEHRKDLIFFRRQINSFAFYHEFSPIVKNNYHGFVIAIVYNEFKAEPVET